VHQVGNQSRLYYDARSTNHQDWNHEPIWQAVRERGMTYEAHVLKLVQALTCLIYKKK